VPLKVLASPCCSGGFPIPPDHLHDGEAPFPPNHVQEGDAPVPPNHVQEEEAPILPNRLEEGDPPKKTLAMAALLGAEKLRMSAKPGDGPMAMAPSTPLCHLGEAGSGRSQMAALRIPGHLAVATAMVVDAAQSPAGRSSEGHPNLRACPHLAASPG